ncbi:MAG: DNA gyrase subunit A [Planctomycetaceae bacterium]|nr:DNA gyrase subunit A [Planctomycetaceae bacterium]
MSSDEILPEDENQGDDAYTDGTLIDLPIEDELKNSYLTYAMSVIVSRALPDVRDGLKPSQRRILVAMNDLNLSPGAHRVKCAKIAGDTSGNYHPHGEGVIYPTLVRMAQEWNMRHVLVDKQGNFGSIAGLPAAAMRYTEARMSSAASLMLEDIKLDTVDFTPTYDETRTEPTVLPAKFPNLLVNGASGIAVGMATSIPPHNLREVCDALITLIDDPDTPIMDLMDIVQGPDFPTGGTICGRSGIRKGYLTGRGTVIVRAKASITELDRGRSRIIISEIPFQQNRDRVVEKIAGLVNDGRVKGISGIRDESDLKEPVRIVVDIKRDENPDVVLNLLYKYSNLQETISIILLALVDGKPRTLNLKEMLEEYIRHRVEVIRRRTQFLLAKARRRKHVVEGQLIALADIDEIIKIVRNSSSHADAKTRLMGIECPASMLARALGDTGYQQFQLERGEADVYHLTAVQADAILRMTLSQLVNLEQEKLGDEHGKLLNEITGYLEILGDRQNILNIIKNDLTTIRDKHGDERRTEISNLELGNVNMDDLITEETMVVSISHRGYIKRIPSSTYKAQRRGGKGLKGATVEEEDPIQHLFVASTHAYLLFFTTKGKVYWQKVYDIPELGRGSKGRAVINLLNLDEGEKILDCIPVRDFKLEDHFLTMATRQGLVKKTDLSSYSRPKKGGIIAIKLKDDDELVDVALVKPGDEIVLSTAEGMAIRFAQEDARPMGRNTSGVKGIKIQDGDSVVGMVVADPEADLLTVCENGYGKRMPFGPNRDNVDGSESSGKVYRTQNRGGKGLRDIKATERNGKVVDIVRVDDQDEVLMMTKGGKIQRIRAEEISVVGRNTQGVRIMKTDDDQIAAVVRIPPEEISEEDEAVAQANQSVEAETDTPETPAEDSVDESAEE